MAINSLNPLLNAVFNHPSPSSKVKDIVNKISSSSGYTLLIPQTSQLEWNVDKDTALPFRDLCLHDDFIASHIIQVSLSSRNNHQRARYYGTLNGRTVIIKDNEIYTHKGFKTQIKARIISEYFFSPALDSMSGDGQFLVYEINVPLIGSPMLSKEVSPTISSKYQLVNIMDDGISGKSKKKKKQLMGLSSSSSSSSSDDSLDKKTFEVILSQYPALGRQLSGPLSLLVDNFDTSECKDEEELLNTLDNAVELAIQIFQSADANIISKMAVEHDLSGDDLTGLLQNYVEFYVYNKLWDRLITFRKEQDREVSDAVESIKNVDISQIGIPSVSEGELLKLDRTVNAAVEEIQKLPNSFGSEAKIKTLLSVLRILGGNGNNSVDGSSKSSNTPVNETLNGVEKTSNGKPPSDENENTNNKESTSTSVAINADLLVSLMVLVLARSGLKNLDSELYYIQNFTYRDTGTGSIGYGLLTFEGVLYHIRHETKKLSELSDANEALWNAIMDKTSDVSSHITKLKKNHHMSSDWQTVVRSRNSTGESSLMLTLQNNNLPAVNVLLSLKDAITIDYIMSDTTLEGASLLLTAVQSEHKEIIDTFLTYIDKNFSKDQKMEYFQYEDKWNRTIGHYLFHALWIIERVSGFVDWNKKDVNGQSPLFALCRCYDHPQYHELLNLGFKSWLKHEKKTTKANPDLLEHVDNKGNTLLHIMKDNKALEKVLEYQVDVNWPNHRGLTPLMIFSKYSRINAILLLRQDDQLDLERSDNRGITALEIAKDPKTLSLLDELYLFDKRPIGDRATTVTRTVFIENELYFIIKSGQPPSSSTITTVKRTFSDFLFLQKWLGYENPFSWIPSLKTPRNPFTVSVKPSRQIIHEVQFQLNSFLRVLLTHPTFNNHELLWEFLLIQDFSKSQSVERCRKKLESKKELNYDDVIVYNPGDLELIEVFFKHACEETERLHGGLKKLSTAIICLKNKLNDLAESNSIFWEKIFEVQFLSSQFVVGKNDFELAYNIHGTSTLNFEYNTCALTNTAGSVITALHQPMGMISQLEQVNSQLYKNQGLLERLNNKNTWPMGMFEDKRDRDVKDTEEKIYNNHREIRRLSSDIKSSHIISASELGGFYNVQEAELKRTIEEFTIGMIKSEKEKFQRLERLLNKCKK